MWVGMSQIELPVFFLRHELPELQEVSYARIAQKCEQIVPPLGERVYSISFDSDGTLWVATVGKHLRGRKPVLVRRKRSGEWGPWFDDAASVLAIFPGVPCCVVTDGGYSSTGSHFGNPFYATAIGTEFFSLQGISAPVATNPVSFPVR
jgi:hypothetical protein